MTKPAPIVSSSHLAEGPLPELSELEFALTLARHAFDRWIVRGMAAAGVPDLSPMDVMVLHSAHHRKRAKTLSDICLVLGIEDTHIVNYSVKKLTAAGLVEQGRQGKEKTVFTTEAGAAACTDYAKTRQQLLLQGMQDLGIDPDQISQLARLLRVTSGHYDQAARAAAAQ